MDPREASIVVAGRCDLADVTFSTWVGELRRMAARLEPAERVGFVGLFFGTGRVRREGTATRLLREQRSPD